MNPEYRSKAGPNPHRPGQGRTAHSRRPARSGHHGSAAAALVVDAVAAHPRGPAGRRRRRVRDHLCDLAQPTSSRRTVTPAQTFTGGTMNGRTLHTKTGHQPGMIQTDTPIISGNTGGPLIDSIGKVIGMVTATAASSRSTAVENIGFATPTARLMPAVTRLGLSVGAE